MGVEDMMGEFIGIDVSHATLDVYVHGAGSVFTVGNDEAAWHGLREKLVGFKPALIVLEATGGHERTCTAALAQAGLPVAVVNPRQVRAFDLATGVLAKSNRADARVLAHFAAAARPAVRASPDEQREALDELLGRRRPLSGMLVQEKNRLQQARAPLVKKEIKGHIAILQQRVGGCNGERQQAHPRLAGVEGPGGSAAFLQRHRPAKRAHAGGRTAGTGQAQLQADRLAGRSSAHCPGFRRLAR